MNGELERLRLFYTMWKMDITTDLLRQGCRARLGEDLVVYILDVRDALGEEVQRALYARGTGPDPSTVLSVPGHAQAEQVVLTGVASAGVLAEVIAETVPEPGDLGTKIRAPAAPHHARFLFVAAGGTKFIQLNVEAKP